MFQIRRHHRQQPKQTLDIAVLASLLHESGRKLDDRQAR